MNNYEMNIRFSELFSEVAELRKTLDILLSTVKPEEELWDNADIVRNWKVSERTLADWRKNGEISYVQLNGKIWYPREAREEFQDRNTVTKGDGAYIKDEDWGVYQNDRRARS